MSLRILCIGDLHLGRSPSRVPLSAGSLREFGPREVLRRSIELAVDQGVDAVVFTGDLVEEKNALFEAYGALSNAIPQLLERGIAVAAVGGNHDFGLLPKLSSEIPGFILLGGNGLWDEHLLFRDGAPILRLQGRSFTERHFRGNPLNGYQTPTDGVPSLGLLHCDVDGADSPYAPVRLSELLEKAPTAWLLGHIHKPTVFSTAPLIFYPGSAQALDPGEPGAHGPWLIEIDSAGQATAAQLLISPLRYDSLPVAVDTADDIEDIRGLILSAVRAWHGAHQEELPQTSLVSLRVHLQGETELLTQLPAFADGLLQEEPFSEQHVSYFFEKILIECRPRVDLETLAEQSDPPGLLARRLRILENRQPSQEYQGLLRKAEKRAAEHKEASTFQALGEQLELSEETLRGSMLEAAWLLLDELLSQKRENL